MRGDVNIYCDESTHLPNDGHPFMVVGAVVCPVELTRSINNRLVELREKHRLSRNFEIKWTKVSPSQVDFYLDVVDYFFDDDDIEFRGVVASKVGLDHAAYNQTHDDWYYKMLSELIKNVLSSSGKSYIYLDKKDTRGGAKVRNLHDVINDAQIDFDRRSVQRVQIVESHHVGLIQLSDLLLGAVNYANRGAENSEAKVRVMERIRSRANISLVQSTLLTATKFNIFRWQPQVR